MDVRLDDITSIKRVQSQLTYGPCAFVFGAQGTRFDMVLCTSGGVAGAPEIGVPDGRIIVSIINFRVAFHFRYGGLVGDYVAEKLGLGRVDANNVAAMLNAVFHADPEGYLASVCDEQYPDQVDHDGGRV